MTRRIRPKRVYAAIWMLYGASILGLLDLLTSSTLVMQPMQHIWLDVTAYISLIVVAFIMSLGIKVAKWLYILLAVVWYLLLIFYLPEHTGHPLNFWLVFIEIILIIAAFYILYQSKSVRWFNKEQKTQKA